MSDTQAVPVTSDEDLIANARTMLEKHEHELVEARRMVADKPFDHSPGNERHVFNSAMEMFIVDRNLRISGLSDLIRAAEMRSPSRQQVTE